MASEINKDEFRNYLGRILIHEGWVRGEITVSLKLSIEIIQSQLKSPNFSFSATSHLFIFFTIVEVTTVQLVENGSVDHNNLVYRKEGEELSPLETTTKAEVPVLSEDINQGGIVIAERSEDIRDDYDSYITKGVGSDLHKETEYHHIEIPEDEGVLVSDNELPSPPLSVCQELQLENTEEHFPPTPSPSPKDHSDIASHIGEVASGDFLSNNQESKTEQVSSNKEEEEIFSEEPTFQRTHECLDEVAPNLSSYTADEFDNQSADYLNADIGPEVPVTQADNFTGISELKEEGDTFETGNLVAESPNSEKDLTELPNLETVSAESLKLDKELTESPSLERAFTESANVEEQVIAPSCLDQQVEQLSNFEGEVHRPAEFQGEAVSSSKFEEEIIESAESPDIFTSQSQIDTVCFQSPLTEYHPVEKGEETEEEADKETEQFDQALVTEPSHEKDAGSFYTHSEASLTKDSTNEFLDNSNRNSLISSESVPSKQRSSLTNSIGESVNCITADNTNRNLKELTCDTSMGTTVGVSDIMADQSEIKESYTSYPYEVENTPSQSSFGHLGDTNEMPSHGEYQTSLDDGDDELPIDRKGTTEHNVYDDEDDYEEDVVHDESEQTNMKTEESYTTFTNSSQPKQEPHADTAALKQKEISNQSIVNTVGGDNGQDFDGSSKMTFNQIREDLEKKNVVGSLQPLHPEQYIMHHQAGVLRQQQQEMVVLNPQTGEVLNDRYSAATTAITTAPTNTSHHFARNLTSNDTVVTTGGNVNGPSSGHVTTGQQKSSVYRKTEQNSVDGTNGGAGGMSANSNGGSAGGRGGASAGGLDRCRQAYNMFECQMAQLTVFLDRALICRRIRPRFNASEITEVLFEHLSPAIDKDSIRVEIRGAATILDVSFSAKSLSGEEDTWSQVINELLIELRQCRRRADNLVNRIIRTEKQRCVLETFADSLSRREDEILFSGNHHGPAASTGAQNHTAATDQLNNIPSQTAQSGQLTTLSAEHKSTTDITNPYDPRNVETLHRFLEIYKDEAERFDTVLMDTNEELEQVRTRIETLEKEIHDIELKQDEHLARELSVLVEPRETGQVEMLVSYVVGRCGWKPAYDIRIFNNDGTMKIVYYGMVQQATGEDWETRYMTLSTAQPGIGGTVPHLGVQRVHFRRDHSPAIPIPRNAISASGITGAASSTHTGPGASISGGTSATGKHSRSCTKLGAFRRSNRPTGTSLNETDRGSVENEGYIRQKTLQ
ncbi:unnamed protein product [Trichobilharzia szidati]|nr:unnamed protein product [Trichobilharzia szidati]